MQAVVRRGQGRQGGGEGEDLGGSREEAKSFVDLRELLLELVQRYLRLLSFV